MFPEGSYRLTEALGVARLAWLVFGPFALPEKRPAINAAKIKPIIIRLTMFNKLIEGQSRFMTPPP